MINARQINGVSSPDLSAQSQDWELGGRGTGPGLGGQTGPNGLDSCLCQLLEDVATGLSAPSLRFSIWEMRDNTDFLA